MHDVEEPEGSEYYQKGDVIGGNYQVLGIVGKGGFGIVYLVRSRQTSEVFALKTFRDELLADSGAREAFKKEALLWVNLERHPFVLAAMWVDEAFGRLFVTMEYLAPDAQGRVSLGDYFAGTTGPLEMNQTLKWAIQFCLGMEHAQAHGVRCHQDIKPANILITQDGTLKISDFGLAAAAETAGSQMTKRSGSWVTGSSEAGFGLSLIQAEGKLRCGTPGYMAPEVYRCEGADIRSDIYSFGLVLWQMASGSQRPPFMGPWRGDMGRFLREIYEHQMAGTIPSTNTLLGVVVERCLKPNPSDRYGSFQELRGDLEPIWEQRTGRKFEIPQIGEKPAGFWSRKGTSLSQLGRHEEAIECFDKALAIDSGYLGAWGGKAVALDGLGRFNEAISHYDRALTIDPRNAIFWLNKGFPLGKLGRHEEAIACYDKALAIDPQKANAWGGKGNGLTQLGRYEEAIACYDKALAIDPRHAHVWNNKSNPLAALGRTEEAIRCYDKALATDPQYVDALLNKGLVLLGLGRHQEAISCYDQALAIDPRNANAWQNKANALEDLGRKAVRVNRFIFYGSSFDETTVGDQLCKSDWASKRTTKAFFGMIAPWAMENRLVKCQIHDSIAPQFGLDRISHSDYNQRTVDYNYSENFNIGSFLLPLVRIFIRDQLGGFSPTSPAVRDSGGRGGNEPYARILKYAGWDGVEFFQSKSYLQAESRLSALGTDAYCQRILEPESEVKQWLADTKAVWAMRNVPNNLEQCGRYIGFRFKEDLAYR